MTAPLRVRDIAALLNTAWEGAGERVISEAADLSTAGERDIAFVGARKYYEQSRASGAGCLIVPPDYPGDGRTLVRSADPRGAFAAVVRRLYPAREVRSGIHPTAVIAESAKVDESASVGPYVVIGEDSAIGAGTIIGPGSSIGCGVTIGASCTLHSNVTIYDGVRIGDRAVLHSGCVIGADGFGFVLTGGRYEKFPQIGRVEIGNDVEIGANSCIDRAALGVTSIGDGTKIDNMVHVGHNCRIGRHVVVAAQTGFSGGVVVEDYAIIGGQVGIGDKARIESRAVLGSGCGVLTSKIVHAGEPVWGTPARPLKQYLEQLAAMAKLPALRREVARLRQRLEELDQRG